MDSPRASQDLPFHPAVASWFARAFGRPTPAQDLAWPELGASHHVLLSAPTGAGKTLAAFLVATDRLIREGIAEGLPDETRILYVSPLRALSADVEKNLLGPLLAIRAELSQMGLRDVEIRTHVRTGDTDAKRRQAATRRPPHIYVTTPESLYVMLTSEGGRRLLRTVQTVIVDEIHSLIQDRRGSHLALSLERLDSLCAREVQRIGLSATQKPISLVAKFLVGEGKASAPKIIDLGHARERDLEIVVPGSPLEAVMSGEVWEEVYSRISELVLAHRTTLVFVNSRRLCERLARHLGERLGAESIAAHHGSLARERRFDAEQRLKEGRLKAIVATASLELGIDVGDVDLVVQVGGPRSIGTFLQRVGRSGHSLGRTPKGRIFPLSRDELVEAVALLDAVKRGELEELRVPEAPLDILAQQLVASIAAEGEWTEAGLLGLARRAYPYRNLSLEEFESVLDMLAHGFSTDRGRRAAHIFRDTSTQTLRPRRGARLTAMTSGGAIPDLADYDVVLEPEGLRIGSLHEDFAIESMAGDVFQLGNTSYIIRRVEPGTVRVHDAGGAPPTLPFWLGEAPSRSNELSLAVSRLRDLVESAAGARGLPSAMRELEEQLGLARPVTEQLVTYLGLSLTALGVLPTADTLVLERFFDEVGSMHLVLHAPVGARLLRAYGLALRKCFCRKFDFELQAAANDDAIILSLGPTHSFPLEEVFGYLKPDTVRDILVQALLVAPLFTSRFRWNAQRALAVPRFRGGRKVPARFARMDADDLMTTCFPDQVACAENLAGDREVPDHPLVQQSVTDATTEAVDLEGLVSLLGRIERGEVRTFARDVTEPSPLAAGILTAKPYAFLDDAPLEERRTQAVLSRRWLDLSDARITGILDQDAILRIVREAWPEPRNADELLDALETYGFFREEEGVSHGLLPHFEKLVAAGRALSVSVGSKLWIAKSRLSEFSILGAQLLGPTDLSNAAALDPAVALREIVRSRLALVGPITIAELGEDLGGKSGDLEVALAALEGEGIAIVGAFRSGSRPGTEWCERRLLARIHRASVERLRAEIKPVTQQEFARFLFTWHGLDATNKPRGADALGRVLERLEGFEAPTQAWESEILPARMEQYDPTWLDELCLSGHYSWLRPAQTERRAGTLRTTPIALVPRDHAAVWMSASSASEVGQARGDHARVLDVLRARGACFYRDLLRYSGLLPAQLEQALSELVAGGVVTSDSFGGLRALLSKSRASSGHQRPRYSLETAGRWTLVGDRPEPNLTGPDLRDEADSQALVVTQALLSRYGVVFRQVLERERSPLPWRDLLVCLRRLEARGEVRGGRFVSGYAGEQFALPAALKLLRQVRGSAPSGVWVSIGAADPLNVVGTLVPGERVPSSSRRRILFRDGICVAVGNAKQLDVRAPPPDGLPPHQHLISRALHPFVRGYVGAR